MLETKRLLLKSLALNDVDKLSRWRLDPVILYYSDSIPDDYLQTPMETVKSGFAEGITAGDNDFMIQFGIHKKEDDSLIGFCQIAFLDNYNKSCRFAITIGEKEQWGKGYGKESLYGIISYCFESLGMNRISAEVYAFNERSVRLFESVGFIKEGILRQYVFKNGKFEDQYWYGLLRSEWKK